MSEHIEDELSILAQSLASEYDRKKYIKVIEMSNTIRTKLAVLQEERKRSSLDTEKSRNTLVYEQASVWSFSDIISSHHRNSSQSIASDNTTLATNSQYDDDTSKLFLDEAFAAGMSLPGRFGRNPIFQVVDHATSLKLKSEFTKRPNADILFQKSCLLQPRLVATSSTIDDTDDDDTEQRLSCDSSSSSEVEFPTIIHIAVRKDASVYTFEKKEIPKEKLVDKGLLAPLNSPQCIEEAGLEPTRLTPIYKKTQTFKGLWRRSCQLNQYTMTKANSVSPLSTPLLFLKARNSEDGRQKWILKLTIIALEKSTPEPQKRFGFTFWCHHSIHHRLTQEETKFALAPDSLVQEALSTWIDGQNDEIEGRLPSLSKADDILRDGRKLYVIYDAELFP